jgi:hypothetical protein
MKLRVIKNGYYVSEDLTNLGMVDQGTLDMSISHLLVIGDVWEKKVYEEDNYEYFTCSEICSKIDLMCGVCFFITVLYVFNYTVKIIQPNSLSRVIT